MTEQVKEFIADVLDSEFCFDRQEDGVFYQEIYADYRDVMENKDASEILSAQDPMQRFWEKLDEWYWQAQSQYEGEVADKVKAALADDDTGLFPEGLTDEEEQEVDDYLKEIVCFTMPEKHFLKQEFKVNIMVDTGDGNYDHTLNSVYPCYCGRPEWTIDNKAAIVWLTKKQGYTKTQMNDALKKGDIKDPKGYLQSLRQELANLPSHMSVLTFLAKMTFEELLQVQGGFRDDYYGDSEYVKDMPYCTIHESPLSELRYSGRTALNCPNWKPGGEYYTKSQDENGKISDYFGKPLVWKDGELIETEGFEF